ncbi:MAG: quinol:electron acceptor oxidoreductase subunit ActD [Pirellulaceae bacterium]|nr:quinol:electron acceptor oxidoreductase subunit ActD [Pirellulaceae bacterium]
MSDHKPEKKAKPPRAFGWVAEYADDNKLLEAARKVRDSGYTRTDAFTPFPVHGIDEALGIKATVLPWFTLCAGATGTCIALIMQWWMNAFDYPYIISGKPFASWPAFIPVAFELTILFAAYTTVIAMLGLNGLPKFSNPMFTNPKFDRATDDRFFLWVDSRDKYFNTEKVKSLLESTGPISVDEVREDDSPSEIPKMIFSAGLALILLALVPGAIVLRMRAARSDQPRWQVFFDMDFQPKKKPQQTTTLFADKRVQRPPVPGTVARGELELADPYYLGYDPDKTAALEATEATRMVAFNAQDGAAAAAAAPSANQAAAPAPAGAAGEPNYAWLTEAPIEATEELFALGKKKFETNCAVCHGYAGYGDGLVSQRATNLAQGYWLQPTSMHEDRIQKQSVGRIYYTVTNGKGKMAGYASSLTPRERWAVVLYVRALQRSQNASIEDVPEPKRAELSSK